MNTSLSPIEELTDPDRDDAVEVLAEAFHGYPVFRYVLKDVYDETYEHHLRLLIGFFVDARLLRGWPVFGIREGGELAAVLLLSDPVFKPRPEQLNHIYNEVAETIGPEAIKRMELFEASSGVYEPKAKTYFVGMVGVRSSSQGRGFGKALMRHVEALSKARPESSGVTLTTEVPENVLFYEGLGYRVIGSQKIGDIETWFFYLEH